MIQADAGLLEIAFIPLQVPRCGATVREESRTKKPQKRIKMVGRNAAMSPKVEDPSSEKAAFKERIY